MELESRRLRPRFLAALSVFLLWLVALGVMAVLSGRSPAPHPVAILPR
jgi:hypothetical protein